MFPSTKSYSRVPLSHGPILYDIVLIITETEAEYRSDAAPTKDTPYLALKGELWGVFCEYLWENWPRYHGTAL